MFCLPFQNDKIKLVVVNENVLGYVFPEKPNIFNFLRCSIIKGCSLDEMNGYHTFSKTDKVRLASSKDFDEFRVSFSGFDKPEIYEYNDTTNEILLNLETL